MKILHYSLGFPPYRTGGLTKFCMDLMEQQVKDGYDVALLWPGEMKFFNTKTKIRFRGKVDRISSFEVINPTPISFDEGIKEFQLFKNEGTKTAYEELLDEIRPDVIHVHTLMGLHKNLIVCAKERKIRLVFSAHDFFPICPKVTMFRNGKSCECVETCNECVQCNVTALSIWKIKILQSPIYRVLKESWIVKRLRKSHRDNYLQETYQESEMQCNNKLKKVEYNYLRNYYNSMLLDMDIVHFNSSVTEKIYREYLDIHNSIIIPITHADIEDKKKIKNFGEKLRITYLGPQGSAKGYYWLKDALDELWSEKNFFELNLFFQPMQKSPYMKIHKKYKYEELDDIFEETDVLVAPSIWYETFGYTVVEALSFGVPVIISNCVGAKDVLPKGAGIVVEEHSVEALKDAINSLTLEKLKDMNKIIFNSADIITIKDFSHQLKKSCYENK